MLSATKSLFSHEVLNHGVAAVKEYPFSLRRTLLALAVGLLAIGLLASFNIAFAQDDAPTTEWLNGYSDNIVTVVAAALVFFMQAGFAFLGAGLIRSKNTTNYLTKSFMDFAIASLGFWAFGFAFMLGDTAGGFIGLTGWFLTGGDYVGWIFQMVFAATAATIVAGAMAERTKLQTYLAYSFIVSALIYPIYGHWVWGDGWLGAMGALDYAGSGVVHAVGGFVALAGAFVVGPRMGKFVNGVAQELPAHSTPFVVAGTFILFFGLVRLQHRLGRRHRPERGQHAAVRRDRRGGRHVHLADYQGQSGHPDGVQRRAGRPGGHHRARQLRGSLGRRGHRRHRRAHHVRFRDVHGARIED